MKSSIAVGRVRLRGFNLTVCDGVLQISITVAAPET
jgi:hypothetical protein